ncbi:hypothetical protein A3Q56_07222 [Intoshia linei]|uniref:DDE Tnp4 domain-containing protein n=1 Tax=Intoshia linei TaxID=1819745 RepID=A0A177AUI3_9BILA|nr:hypothetical protein A3Q56_07222 [Intoshia linei]
MQSYNILLNNIDEPINPYYDKFNHGNGVYNMTGFTNVEFEDIFKTCEVCLIGVCKDFNLTATGCLDLINKTALSIKDILEHNEAKIFWSGKHHNYCLKREIGVLPNGMCAFKSDSVPGSVLYMSVFKQIVPIYKNFLSKEIDDINVNDAGSMFEWAILADKRYHGTYKLLRVLIPPKGRDLICDLRVKMIWII